jgi:hypothetical protein
MIGTAVKLRGLVEAVLDHESPRYGVFEVFQPLGDLMGAKGPLPHGNLMLAFVARHRFLV